MATKVLTTGGNTITTFNSCNFLNTTGTFSKTDGVIAVNVTGVTSPGTSTTRGFYFAPGDGRRMHYTMECRFVSSEGAAQSKITRFAWEGATARTLTLTSDWQTVSGVFVRSRNESYRALTFYIGGTTTFPLGTYYIRNIYIERMPWIFTVNGRPLQVTV